MDISQIPPLSGTERHSALMATARDLEATFLAEMLGHAGLGATDEAFGGGHGEAQFASFLKQEQARLIADRGGIGLAEMIFKSMTAREHAP
jgi:Rod binding domain-containing protein